jgi:hypothetical protein
MLKDAVPLKPHQQLFHQAGWLDCLAPNFVLDPITGSRLNSSNYTMKTPPEPWIRTCVCVIKGPLKYRATVVAVNRGDHVSNYPTGVRITVSFDQVSFSDRGFGVKHTYDYSWIRDFA